LPEEAHSSQAPRQRILPSPPYTQPDESELLVP
jgi:hypothetical protein